MIHFEKRERDRVNGSNCNKRKGSRSLIEIQNAQMISGSHEEKEHGMEQIKSILVDVLRVKIEMNQV